MLYTQNSENDVTTNAVTALGLPQFCTSWLLQPHRCLWSFRLKPFLRFSDFCSIDQRLKGRSTLLNSQHIKSSFFVLCKTEKMVHIHSINLVFKARGFYVTKKLSIKMANADTRKYANSLRQCNWYRLHVHTVSQEWMSSDQCWASVMLVSRSWIPVTNKFVFIYSCYNLAADKHWNNYRMCTAGLIWTVNLSNIFAAYANHTMQYMLVHTQPFEDWYRDTIMSTSSDDNHDSNA
jgi:hypothetical protein